MYASRVLRGNQNAARGVLKRMDKQTPDTPNALAPAILLAAAGLGVLGEILFLPGILGANLFLWTASVVCLLYTSPSPRDRTRSRMPSSA